MAVTDVTEPGQSASRPRRLRGGINWQAKYLEQIQARLASLEAGQRALDAKVEQVRDELRQELRDEIGQVRSEMAQVETRLRGEIAKLEAGLRSDSTKVETGLRGEIAQVRGDVEQLRSEINKLRDTLQREIRMVIWGVVAGILATLVTGALRAFQ